MLPPDATPISTEQLLQTIGEQHVLIQVLQTKLRLIQEELKEATLPQEYSEPVRVPQKRVDSERM